MADIFLSPRLQNQIGGAEYLLRALFRYRLDARAHPMLNVPATVLHARQPQRLAADERDALDLDLSKTARRVLAVGEV